MMAHVYNPSPLEKNAGTPGVQGHLHLRSKVKSSLKGHMSTEGLIPAPMNKNQVWPRMSLTSRLWGVG